ncbi:MAG TPA: N-acetyl-D-Glu racemase DgcA [Hyphomicrobiaceae bacterium]|nr:N-acetyl-D-Glu racemase DgcA [Hyphomicrobiaceae bacterium]
MPDFLPTSLQVSASVEAWPIAGSFVISRGAKREAEVVVAEVRSEGCVGRGECCPYPRYGETLEGVRETIAALGSVHDRAELAQRLPAGAARNAVDCALWDWEAKRAGMSAARLAGVPTPRPLTTAYTISLAGAEEMAAKAAAASIMPLLKLKLGGAGDAERLRQIRAACPETRLIADANEAWTPDLLPELMAVAAETRIELIEQPLPAGADAALGTIERKVPVCADESLHTRDDLAQLAQRYDAVNIKLDKAGGLTEALALAAEARAAGLMIMVGCMVATSLAMAPALLVAQMADWVDLDGPLLLARDRTPSLRYEGSLVYPPSPELWG